MVISNNLLIYILISCQTHSFLLERRRVKKYIRFLILFIPWSSNCKKNLFPDFRKFYYTTFHMNLHHYTICYCACAQRNICNLGFEHCSVEKLTKSKIVKVKLFYNYLTHHLPAITEFNFFWGHKIIKL